MRTEKEIRELYNFINDIPPERTFTESEMKELLTGLLKEIRLKRFYETTGLTDGYVYFSDIRTLFNKLLQ